MRLKTFEALSMNQALKLVREELGEDAIIISTSKIAGGKGIKVTAAIDNADDSANGILILNQARMTSSLRELEDILSFHNIPGSLMEKIHETGKYIEFSDYLTATQKIFDVIFVFSQIELSTQRRPIMLIGLPGAGKTITAAKIATTTALAKIPVTIASIDAKRAGGVEQLAAFTNILNLDLETPDTPKRLQTMLNLTKGSLTIIDSFGINPYDKGEVQELQSFIESADIEPILVQPAGLDPLETYESVKIFHDLGARLLIISKVHSSRRLGGILAAGATNMIFAGVSGSARVDSPLDMINSRILAALMLRHTIKG